MRVLSLLVSLVLLAICCQGAAGSCATCHLSRAVCVSGSCECTDPAYPWGNVPAFKCYSDDEIATEVLNDPTLYNYNRESVPFPFPCRFMQTHFNSDLLKHGGKKGVCEVMVHGFIAKSKGKFFVHGFGVALRIVLYHSVFEYTHRIYGIANDSVLDHTFQASQFAFLPDGTDDNDSPNYSDPSNGIDIQVFVEAHTGNLVYKLDGCGVRVELKPYDEHLREDLRPLPGLSVALEKNHNPSFLSTDLVVGLGDINYPGGETFSDIKLTDLTIPESIISRSFANNAHITQSQPFQNSECMYGFYAQGDCNSAGPASRKDAFQSCLWMLNFEKYIRCMDKDTYVPFNLLFNFNNCISSWCANIYSCEDVITAIESEECDAIPSTSPYASLLVDFINGNLCPP